MNLRDLQYLVALAETRHFGRAAQRCHVSQPTLSAQLKKLEEYLGVALIERRPRKVALTAAGLAVIERARRMLQDAEDIRALAHASQDPLAGQLKVGLIPTLGPYLLPRVMPRFAQALPKLALLLHEYQTGPLVQHVLDGELDLALLALPADTRGLQTRPLFAESFLVAMPGNHRLASRRRLRTADLGGEKLLLLEEGHCLREHALEACARAGVEEQGFRATSLETLRQMVAAGAGVTLLPRLAAEGPFASARGLVLRPFAPPVPSRTIGAAWRRSTSRGAAIAAVCDIIQKAG
ncbi:MAG TPA: LysR substrate-binding domain-containing protein [Steroidobacteraceae bacterium]|nr:LysR substrate-binding domain-containing protein [Steroidobacteraceae bacterium]